MTLVPQREVDRARTGVVPTPGVFPPVRIGDEHFFDGGLVNSIPLERAVARGADTVWVLHVGRMEEDLVAPRFLWEVAFVAFEISRRHRFLRDLERVGSEVTVHVLPTGLPQRPSAMWSNLSATGTLAGSLDAPNGLMTPPANT